MSDSHRRRGDRRDAKLVRDLDSMHVFMPFLLPNRTDNEAVMNETIDLSAVLDYLDRKNADNPTYKYTIFQVICAALAKTIYLRPKMNRFIAGHRTYARNDISFSFIVKKKFLDDAPESVAILTMDQESLVSPIQQFHDKLQAIVYDVRVKDQQDSTTDAAMISSVAIAPGDPGSGVKVNIKNYDGENNITKVTSQQYAMVAQMAGVTDASIVVTANRPVSGESALTGVYKALATDGVSLNTKNTSTANQMLEATQPAIDANKDDKTYPGKLMAAIGDVSKQLAEMKQDNKNLATKQDIQDMLNKALEKRGIEDKTSSTNVTQITNALFNFQNSPISSSKNYVKNVDNTINNVKNSAGNLMNKAKNWANSQSGKKTISEAKSLWQKFVDWIKGLFS